MHAWLLILSSSWWFSLFLSLYLSLASYKTTSRSYRVVFFYLPVGGTLSSCGFAPSFSPPSPTAAGIVEEVCFDRIKCNFRVPSTAFSLERLSAKPISCYKLWMELMRSAGRREDFYIPGVTLWASFSHVYTHFTRAKVIYYECYCINSNSILLLVCFTNERNNYNTKRFSFRECLNIWLKLFFLAVFYFFKIWNLNFKT